MGCTCKGAVTCGFCQGREVARLHASANVPEWVKGTVCPHCGGEVLDGENMDVEQGENWVECDSCGEDVVVEVSFDFRTRAAHS